MFQFYLAFRTYLCMRQRSYHNTSPHGADPHSPLVCTAVSQELVNLLLLGRAYSNVFDGHRVMGDGDSNVITRGRESEGKEGGDLDCVVLTGVPERGRIGFLTLFEAYKHVEVCRRAMGMGNNLAHARNNVGTERGTYVQNQPAWGLVCVGREHT